MVFLVLCIAPLNNKSQSVPFDAFACMDFGHGHLTHHLGVGVFSVGQSNSGLVASLAVLTLKKKKKKKVACCLSRG